MSDGKETTAPVEETKPDAPENKENNKYGSGPVRKGDVLRYSKGTRG